MIKLWRWSGWAPFNSDVSMQRGVEMSVTVLDLTGKDAAAVGAEIEKVAEDAHAKDETVTALSPLPGGNSLIVVSSPSRVTSAAAELEAFKRLLDNKAIDWAEYNEVKERLIKGL